MFKHLRLILFLVFLLAPFGAFANTVNYNNLSVNFVIDPNYGTGDNVYGTIFGTNVNLQVYGGTPYSWFDGADPQTPGSQEGGGTTIYFDYGSGTLGGTYYESPFVEEATFNTRNYTLPTNGQNTFTVTLPATLGLVVVVGCNGGPCTTYNLTTLKGTLVLSYTYYNNYGGFYLATEGYFVAPAVPEPGTLGLMAIGISALALCKGKLLMRASS